MSVLAALGSQWEVIEAPVESMQAALFDTRVWTLWFHDACLVADSRSLTLCAREGGWAGRTLASGARNGEVPRFAAAFPSSPLQTELTKVINIRGLQKAADLEWSHQRVELRDASGKIVCRLEFASVGPHSEIHVRIIPLRGYPKAVAEAASILSEFASADAGGPLVDALGLAGIVPVEYSLQPDIALSPDMAARDAVIEVATRMLSIARFNEAGIIDDSDTEFLHDFRVSLRKIRSVLSLINDIFPPDTLQRWKDSLSDICRKTNRLRDLDVYRLARESLTEYLPPALREGIRPFFDDIENERAEAVTVITAYFRSAGYRKAIRSFGQSLGAAGSLPPCPRSSSPIGREATRRIQRRFNAITKLARILTTSTPDREFHHLRIHCKKLRYLIEFFGSFYEGSGAILKQLTRLQNRLGRFNDTSVQQARLLDFWRSGGHRDDPGFALSLGGLVAILHRGHNGLRGRVLEALDAFCAPENSKRFHHLNSCA